MEYSIKKLSQLAGVSTRTLRYYDEIGLLTPTRTSSNGYRIYSQKELDILQQILFYREMGIALDEIRQIISSKDFDGKTALRNHLSSLMAKKEQINRLIVTVEQTISAMEGKSIMTDSEKFECFKEKIISENEEKYGREIREKYGEDTINASNLKLKNMASEQYNTMTELSDLLSRELKAAFLTGNPASDEAQKVCALHKEWLLCFWNDYSSEAHIGLAQMYVDDPRFKKYYDKIAVGCAEFLRDAIIIYSKSALLKK